MINFCNCFANIYVTVLYINEKLSLFSPFCLLA